MEGIRIYTTSTCPYCRAAKSLLESLGLEYEEIVLDDRPGLRERLARENGGFRTVPMIFIDGRLVGGYTDLVALHRGGGLAPDVRAVTSA